MNKRRLDSSTPLGADPVWAGLCLLDAGGHVLAVDAGFAAVAGGDAAALCGQDITQLAPAGIDLQQRAVQRLVLRRVDDGFLAINATVTELSTAAAGLLVLEVSVPGLGRVSIGTEPAIDAESMLDAIGDQLFAFQVRAGVVRTLFAGPHSAAVLGAPLPAAADLMDAFARALHSDDRRLFDHHLRRLRRGEAASDTMRVLGVDGVWRHIALRSWPRHRGARLVAFGIASDVTAHQTVERLLHTAIGRAAEARREPRSADTTPPRSEIDSLTGVYNRPYLTTALAAATSGMRCGGAAPAVILIDLDHLHRINDTYGRGAGDAALTATAIRIASAVRADDIVARFGGDQFTVLLCSGVSSDEALRGIAEAVRHRIETDPIGLGSIGIAVSVSIGAARAADSLTEPDDLLDACDRALFAAQRVGGGQTRLHSEWSFDDCLAHDPEAVRIAESLAMTVALRTRRSAQQPMRVATLALRTAERMGQSGAMLVRCRLGGWLHDVGLIAMPDRILAADAARTDGDGALWRSHPVLGAEIIQRIAGLREASAAIRHQRECYDGTGYPDGLRGHAIPLEARIVAACVLYANETDRSADADASSVAARTVLARHAGTTLDPRVVDALHRVLAEDEDQLRPRELPSGTTHSAAGEAA